jgi:hypothetical protein
MISFYLKLAVDWPFGTIGVFISYLMLILIMRVILMCGEVLSDERLEQEVGYLTK